jgi:hypothetical protein
MAADQYFTIEKQAVDEYKVTLMPAIIALLYKFFS